MGRETISATTTVAEVLAEFPTAASAFVARRLDCIGCDMSAFETISDVAANYRLDARQLLADVRSASRAEQSKQKTRKVAVKR